MRCFLDFPQVVVFLFLVKKKLEFTMDLSKTLLLCMAVLVMSQCSVGARVDSDKRLRLRRNDVAADDNVSGYADYADDQSEKSDDYMGTDDGEKDDDEEANDTDNGLPVGMKSVGQTFRVKQGASVWMNCESVNAGEAVTVWKKNTNSVLYHGKFKTATENNIDRFDNQTLYIHDITATDAGNFSCNVLATNGHTLVVDYVVQVLTPAEIVRTLPSREHRRILEGRPVEIVCETRGYPEPTLIWSKNGEAIIADESHDIEIRHNSIHIASAKKEHAGTYQCLAFNEVEPPAHDFVAIQVLFAPTVHIHQEVVNGAEGIEVELSCIIHGEPGSDVTWLKDNHPISEDDSNVNISAPVAENGTQLRRQKSVLTIASVRSTDFGKYTCKASNEQGSHSRSIKLVQHPAISPAGGSAKDEPKLRWTIHSRQPITHVTMQYRKLNEDNPNAQPNDDDWVTVDVPDQDVLEEAVYVLSKKLNFPSGSYEARATVGNKHGWSDYAHYYFEGEAESGNEYRVPYSDVVTSENMSLANRQTAATILSTVVMCLLVRLA